MNLPDGFWRIERTGGFLPPMIGVRKRVRGKRGDTRVGSLARWPFRLEACTGSVELTYDPPLSFWVDELRPGESEDVWLGLATLGGHPIGSFRMVRIG